MFDPRHRRGRKAERLIAQFVEDLSTNYLVYNNLTELGPIDLVVVNLKTAKTAFIDCKAVSSYPSRKYRPSSSYKRKGEKNLWKHLNIWLFTCDENDEIRVVCKREFLKYTPAFKHTFQQEALRIFKKTLE